MLCGAKCTGFLFLKIALKLIQQNCDIIRCPCSIRKTGTGVVSGNGFVRTRVLLVRAEAPVVLCLSGISGPWLVYHQAGWPDLALREREGWTSAGGWGTAVLHTSATSLQRCTGAHQSPASAPCTITQVYRCTVLVHRCTDALCPITFITWEHVQGNDHQE